MTFTPNAKMKCLAKELLLPDSNIQPSASAVVLIGGCSLINLHIKHPLVRELKDLKGHNCKSSVH